MKETKYSNSFSKLSHTPLFTAEEGRRAGIPSRMLSYFCSQGSIERIRRGVYKISNSEESEEFEWEELASIAKSIPNGIICLLTALNYYDLTDEIMREYWIAVPHSTSSPKRENTRVVRMRNITLGQVNLKIGAYDLKIFDQERTIVDAFRYLDKEIALKALKAYLLHSKENKPNINKLMRYAKILRTNITPYILAYTT